MMNGGGVNKQETSQLEVEWSLVEFTGAMREVLFITKRNLSIIFNGCTLNS